MIVDTIRQWGMSLCAAAAFCTILRILAPEGGVGKVYQTLLGIFLLCCMAAPFLSFEAADWTLPLEESQWQQEEIAQDLTDTLTEEQLRLAKEAIGAKAAAVLTGLGVTPREIQVFLLLQEDGETYTCRVELLLDYKDENRQQEIAAALKYQLGVESRYAYE